MHDEKEMMEEIARLRERIGAVHHYLDVRNVPHTGPDSDGQGETTYTLLGRLQAYTKQLGGR